MMNLAKAIERGKELAREGNRQIFVYCHTSDFFWLWYKRGGPEARLTAICTPSGNVKKGKELVEKKKM